MYVCAIRQLSKNLVVFGSPVDRYIRDMKVIGSRSRSRKEKGGKSLYPQCKTSRGNSSSVTRAAAKFAHSMGFFCYGGSNGVTAIFVT